MRLGIRWLRDVGGLNSWAYGDTPDFYQGDAQTLYLQLVDESVTLTCPSTVEGRALPRRYVPAAGATLTAVLDSIEDAKRVTRVMTQPFASDDRSIWRLDISAADPVRGTVDLRLTLSEGGIPHYAVLKAGLRIRSTQRV